MFPVRNLHNYIYIGLVLSWSLSITHRASDSGMKRFVRYISGLLLFFMVVQMCKYQFFQGQPVLCRYLWYAYYIPMLLLPVLLFMTSLSVGRQTLVLPKGVRLTLLLPTGLLILGVLTNDLHQLVFHFAEGWKNWDTEYTYGTLYFAVIVWIGLLFAATILMLFYRCRITRSKKMALLPLLLMVFGAAYLFAFTTPYFTHGIRLFQLPEAFCFLIIVFCESLFYTGLLPSNTHHATLFSASTVNANILDREGNVCYSSGYSIYTPEENQRMHSISIGSGVLQWSEDLSTVRELQRTLKEVRQQMTEENELIRVENELEEESIRVKAQSRLYETIGTLIQPQLAAIERTLDGLDPAGEDWNEKMARACVYNAYVKRRSNIELITEQKKTCPPEELRLSLKESMEYIARCGAVCELNFYIISPMRAETLKSFYDLFEQTVEQGLGKMRALLVTAAEQEGKPRLRLVIEGTQDVQLEDTRYVRVETEREDESLYVTFTEEAGGDVQ